MNPLKLGAAPAPSTTMGQASQLPHYGRGRSCYWCCHYLIQGSSVTGGAAPAPWRQNGQNGWPFWCREPVPLLFPCKQIDWTAVFSIASSGTCSSQPIPGTDPFQCQEPAAPHCSCFSMWLDNCVLFLNVFLNVSLLDMLLLDISLFDGSLLNRLNLEGSLLYGSLLNRSLLYGSLLNRSLLNGSTTESLET